MSEKMTPDVPQTMSPVEWVGLIPAAVCLLIGLLTWLLGHRMLRPALVGAGAAMGAAVGWIVGAVLHPGMAEWLLAGLGALALGIAAWLAYRIFVTIMMAAMLACLSGAATWVGADLGFGGFTSVKPQVVSAEPAPSAVAPHAPDPKLAPAAPGTPGSPQIPQGSPGMQQPVQPADPARGLPEEITAFVRRATGQPQPPDPQAVPAVPAEEPTIFVPDEITDDDMHRQILRWGGEVRQKATMATETWESAEPAARKAVMGAALLGAILGAALGMLAPTLSAIAATASVGAALLLVGGWVGVMRLDAAQSVPIPSTIERWALVWLITSLAGMVIQWMTRKRAVDKPA